MKRITFSYHDPDVPDFVVKCQSASWGDGSRNVVIRGAQKVEKGYPPVTPFLLVPLTGVKAMSEEEW